jgi:preprotein translocase subunit SecG
VEIIVTFLTAFHFFVSIVLVITVLLQPGKGGDLGSVFGGGMSESIFGSSGAVPFLTKATRILAVLFVVSSLSLGYFSSRGVSSSVVEDLPTAPVQEEVEVLTVDEGKPSSDVSTQNPTEEQGSTSQKEGVSGSKPDKDGVN